MALPKPEPQPFGQLGQCVGFAAPLIDFDAFEILEAIGAAIDSLAASAAAEKPFAERNVVALETCADRLNDYSKRVGDRKREPGGHLGLNVDLVNRTVSKNGMTVEFDNKKKAWQLFVAIFNAGMQGEMRDELTRAGLDEGTTVDKRKGVANELLGILNVEISADQCGKWTLVQV